MAKVEAGAIYISMAVELVVMLLTAGHHVAQWLGKRRQKRMMLFVNLQGSDQREPPLNAVQSPGEIFANFFVDEVLKCLCANTNKNAAKNNEKGENFYWNEITPEEQQKYLGLFTLHFTVCNFPKMSDFWRRNTIFHVSFPATVMSRDRFMAITSNLGISDPEEDAANDRKRAQRTMTYFTESDLCLR